MQLKMGGDDTVDDRPDPADEQLLQSPLPLVTVSSRQEIVQGRIVALENGPFAVGVHGVSLDTVASGLRSERDTHQYKGGAV